MSSVGISSLSDEILLCILNYVPVCDLLLNVARVCRKLRVLCQDKTLLTHVCLSEEYTVGLVFIITFTLYYLNNIKYKCSHNLH